MFATNLEDELGITAMVFYAATSLESQNLIPPRVSSSRYHARLCRSIQTRLSSESTCPSVALMMAICGAIAANNDGLIGPSITTLERSNDTKVNLQGLCRLITAAGGWTTVEASSDALCYVLNWYAKRYGGNIHQ
jgi:hypothetical protein